MKKLIMMVASAAMFFSCAPKQAEHDVILFDAEDFQAVVDGKETSLYTLKAGDLVKLVCTACGGSGGGKPDSAMGGGKDPSKMAEALNSVVDFVAAKVN